VKILLYVFVGLSLSIFTWADSLSSDQLKKIRVGVEKADLKTVVDTLNGIENPFKCERKGLGKVFDSSPPHNCPRENTGQDLLRAAFKTKPCRDDIAVELLRAGARYSFGERYSAETEMKDAYEAVCPKTIDYLIKNRNEDEVASSATKYFVYSGGKVKTYIEGLKEGYSIDADVIEALKPITNSFREFVTTKCPDTSKSSLVCTAREAFETSKANTEKAIKDAENYAAQLQSEAEYEKSSTGIKAAICEIDNQIAEAKAVIDREKQIGKVSGSVNMATLNRAGSKIVDLREVRKKLEKSYRKQAGKGISSDACKE
jgi:hypothetical protein